MPCTGCNVAIYEPLTKLLRDRWRQCLLRVRSHRLVDRAVETADVCKQLILGYENATLQDGKRLANRWLHVRSYAGMTR